jgi:hypothetical protein
MLGTSPMDSHHRNLDPVIRAFDPAVAPGRHRRSNRDAGDGK